MDLAPTDRHDQLVATFLVQPTLHDIASSGHQKALS
jgi:hypothetical protein